MKDGGLRNLFRQRFQSWQWSSIESAGTVSGVPDSEFCTPSGKQGWIEFKQTHIYHVKIKPFQVAWLTRRCRYGGRAWIAVRRWQTASIHGNADELWLMSGDQADALFYGGLNNVYALCWSGGPGLWNYEEIAQVLEGK